MKQPMQAQYATGRIVYVVIQAPDGTFWNTDSEAFEVYNSAHWSDYAVSLSEFSGSGIYRGVYPIDDVEVITTEFLYDQGTNPTPTLPSASGGDTIIGADQTQGANVFSIDSSVIAAANLSKSAGSMETGIVQSGANTINQVVTDLDGAVTNNYNGRVVIFTSGGVNKAAAIITGFNTSTKILTFTTLPDAPEPADELIVV